MGEPVRPSDLLASSVGFLLSKLGFHAAARFAAALEPVGVEPRQFGLLRFVAMAQGQTQQALADMLEIPSSGMVALIDEMEDRGLVERRRNPHDRRAHALHLTPKGRRVLDRGMAVAQRFEAEMCEVLRPDEREQLLELLRRLAADQGIPVGVHPGLVASQAEGGS